MSAQEKPNSKQYDSKYEPILIQQCLTRHSQTQCFTLNHGAMTPIDNPQAD
ncbi:hypothetical protein H2248_007508 [Termitomyces sp. 'cryptogamus']|nr:hypothetical protein H2248_007508 [Termitomyces sp. 'cryptogamus']